MLFGIKILLKSNYLDLVSQLDTVPYIQDSPFAGLSEEFIELWPTKNLGSLAKYARLSRSQLGQDLLCLQFLDFKQGGIFVEIGAADGMHLSNTYMLEKNFGWKGLCVEPGKIWHSELLRNRNCYVDLRAVWNLSGEQVGFRESKIAVLSTFTEFIDGDLHAEARNSGKTYNVETLKLDELLSEYKFPSVIDYLSIDTEGSESDILKAIDWSSWEFNFISVEHNYTSNREEIKDLLETVGYKRVLTEISDFDDYYVPNK